MLHLITKLTTQQCLEVNEAFEKLFISDIADVLEEVLQLSNAKLDRIFDNKSIEDISHLAVCCTPIVTKFGMTTLDNIPTGVKGYALLKVGIADKEHLVPEYVFGNIILKKIIQLAEGRDVWLFGVKKKLSSACMGKTKAVKVVMNIDGNVVSTVC